MAFAQYLHCAPDIADFRIISSPAAVQRARAFLTEAGKSQGDRLVYANPAARWETKHWDIKPWAALADLLAERAGASVIFVGSPDDLAYIEKITALMKQNALVAAGHLNLADAVALMRLCSVYVGSIRVRCTSPL